MYIYLSNCIRPNIKRTSIPLHWTQYISNRMISTIFLELSIQLWHHDFNKERQQNTNHPNELIYDENSWCGVTMNSQWAYLFAHYYQDPKPYQYKNTLSRLKTTPIQWYISNCSAIEYVTRMPITIFNKLRILNHLLSQKSTSNLHG